jgi:hypothetical protein
MGAFPGTTSTAAPAPTLRPPRADGGRPFSCAAARAEHVEPQCPGDQRGPDRGRPQHVAAGGKLLVPAFDDGLRLGARGGIGNLPLGVDGNVQAPRPHAHRRSMPRRGPGSHPHRSPSGPNFPRPWIGHLGWHRIADGRAIGNETGPPPGSGVTAQSWLDLFTGVRR